MDAAGDSSIFPEAEVCGTGRDRVYSALDALWIADKAAFANVFLAYLELGFHKQEQWCFGG